MKRWILAGLVLFLAGCVGLSGTQPGAGDAEPSEAPPTEAAEATSEPRPTLTQLPAEVKADLPDLGEAPELENEVWLNTDQPLRMVDLRGKVVLLDMWTFG